MTTVNIALPETAREFVNRQVSAGHFRDESDYILSLIEADRHRRIRTELREELMEGLATPSTPMTSDDWNEIRQTGRQMLNRRQTQ